jgi:hypothetical protein
VPKTFDVLNTNGGHIVVGFMLMFVGAVFFKIGIPKGEDLILVGSTLIGRAMIDQHLQQDKEEPKGEGKKNE